MLKAKSVYVSSVCSSSFLYPKRPILFKYFYIGRFSSFELIISNNNYLRYIFLSNFLISILIIFLLYPYYSS